MPATHEPAVELQHLVHEGATLIAVVDDHHRLALIHTDDVEMKVGHGLQCSVQYARNAAFPRTIPPDSGTT